MAVFKKSIFGGLSGKIGQFVIYEMNGKQVVRSNTKPNNPKTPAQMAQRAKFSMACKGMSPLNNVIKIGYKNSDINFGKLISMAYHNAISGIYPDLEFDYSKVSVAKGKVQLPSNILVLKLMRVPVQPVLDGILIF